MLSVEQRKTTNHKPKTTNSLNSPIFITGIGTGIGKTVVSAIIAEALEADYWKHIQAGIDTATDSDWVKAHLSNPLSVIHPECYRLKLAASPHYSSRQEGIAITVQRISNEIPIYNRNLIVEGAGGLFVPLNNNEFIKDLIIALRARVVLVSRKYLGSINHSLLTAAECRQTNIPVAGWFFHGYEPSYENEIISWSGFPKIASVPIVEYPEKSFIKEMAELNRMSLIDMLC